MDNLNVVKMDIFDRMVDKLHLTGNTIVLIYRLGGYPDPEDQHYETLKKILSPSSLRPVVNREVPHWEPLPSTAFLVNIQPDVDSPPNDLWRVLWTQLRLMYAGGRI